MESTQITSIQARLCNPQNPSYRKIEVTGNDRPVIYAHGENRYETNRRETINGKSQMTTTPGMENHLAITYRDEISERIWMVGDIVIVFEHYPNPGQFWWMVGQGGGSFALQPEYIRIDAILQERCRAWKRSIPWYRDPPATTGMWA